MIQATEIVEIGILRKPHGTRGEIQCSLQNDYLDLCEPEYVILEVDNIFVPFFLEEYRYKNDETVLFTFENITNEVQAANLTNCRVFLHTNQLPNDVEVSHSPTTFVGFAVMDKEHGKIGTIVDIDTSTINPLFALDNDVIFPAHEDLILNIDQEKKVLYVELPEGLLAL